jgi:16S rRNA (cytidine1402-2'-O)-methyltransferase
MLYLVATPIGNLGDVTLRALEALRSSDLILCEDTRRSRILLDKQGIVKPLAPYHKFNESRELEALVHRLREGATLSLISDAGTPAICDPGHLLITRCIQEGLPFTVVPGAFSPVCALLLSGFEPVPFQFIGFLPRETKPLRLALAQALCHRGATVAFEAPQRIRKTLSLLATLAPERPIALVREMTKLHEEVLRGAPATLDPPEKGEMVLVISPSSSPPALPLPPNELIPLLAEEFALSPQEAVKLAAKLLKVPKRSIY